MSYDPTIKAAVLVDLVSGMTQSAVSKKHNVPLRTVKRWAEMKVKIHLSSDEAKAVQNVTKSAKNSSPKNGTKNKPKQTKKGSVNQPDLVDQPPKKDTLIYEIVPGANGGKTDVERSFDDRYVQLFSTMLDGYISFAETLTDKAFVKLDPSGAIMIAQFLSMIGDKVKEHVRDEDQTE